MAKVAIKKILDSVTQEFGVTRGQLLSRQRPDRISFPRHVTMLLIYEVCRHSSLKLGRMFKREHTTVLVAMAGVRSRCSVDRKLRERVNRLREQFGLEPYQA